MYEFDRKPSPAQQKVSEPPQTEFTLKLDANQALTIQKLAERAGVSAQEVVERLTIGYHFEMGCAVLAGDLKPTPGYVLGDEDYWLHSTLFSIGLLKGDALTAYKRDVLGKDKTKK